MRALIFYRLAIIAQALLTLAVRALEEQIGEHRDTRHWLSVHANGLLESITQRQFELFLLDRNRE